MSQRMILCKLNNEQVKETRSLYEEVFWEDAKQFVDYYYENKACQCMAFVLRNDQDEIVSMLHLDPYMIRIKYKTEVGYDYAEEKAYYVVCVATKKEERHKGHMARLLEAAEAYCLEHKVPLLFLMPADEAIYRPFGYQFIYDRNEYYVNYNIDILQNQNAEKSACRLDENVSVDCIDYNLCKLITVDCEQIKQLVAFSNQWLDENTDFHLVRNEKYYVNLVKELAAQKGCIYLFYVNQTLEGYYAQTKAEISNPGCGRDGVQEAMLSARLKTYFLNKEGTLPILESEHVTPVIMAKFIGYQGEKLKPYISRDKTGWITELI